MMCTDAIAADLSAALDKIPPADRGVTARRAAAQIEEAASTISANLSLLEWEAGRVQRVAIARADRERAAAAERAEAERNRAEVDRERAKKHLNRIERDRKIAGAR